MQSGQIHYSGVRSIPVQVSSILRRIAEPRHVNSFVSGEPPLLTLKGRPDLEMISCFSGRPIAWAMVALKSEIDTGSLSGLKASLSEVPQARPPLMPPPANRPLKTPG